MHQSLSQGFPNYSFIYDFQYASLCRFNIYTCSSLLFSGNLLLLKLINISIYAVGTLSLGNG